MTVISLGRLTVRLDDVASSGPHIVRLHGELDATNSDLVLRACLARGARDVVVDLGAVTFLSCAGYGALVNARQALEEHAGSLSVRSEAGQPARLLSLIAKVARQAVDSPRVPEM